MCVCCSLCSDFVKSFVFCATGSVLTSCVITLSDVLSAVISECVALNVRQLPPEKLSV